MNMWMFFVSLFLEIRQKLRVLEHSRIWSASDISASKENLEYLGRQIFYTSRPLHFYQRFEIPLQFVLNASYNSDREIVVI